MDRRKFLKRFGIGALAIPFGFKAAKALTKEARIVQPAYPAPDDDGQTFTGLTTMQTQAIGVFSMATPNGDYLEKYGEVDGKPFGSFHQYWLNIRTNKRVTDKALISRLELGIPYGGEKIG